MSRRTFYLASGLAAILLLSTAGSADAAKRSMTTFDEYKKIGVGLLLDQEKRLEYKEVKEVPRKLPDGITFTTASENTYHPDEENAEMSNAMPLVDVIDLYDAGEFEEALKGLLPWARNGDPIAQELLGLMYREGKGIKKNDEQAAYWFKKAAESGRPTSQHFIGTMHYLGEGVEQNHIKSLMWMYNAEATYADMDPGKKRVEADIKNLSLRLTKRDQERARSLSQDWLAAMHTKMENAQKGIHEPVGNEKSEAEAVIDDDLKSLLNKRSEPKYGSEEDGNEFGP